MSQYNLIFCDLCNLVPAMYPNLKEVDRDVLRLIFEEGGVALSVDSKGRVMEYQQRGVAVLNSDGNPPAGWMERDYGDECPFCAAEEKIAESLSTVMGEDETYVGEIPEIIELALKAREEAPEDNVDALSPKGK